MPLADRSAFAKRDILIVENNRTLAEDLATYLMLHRTDWNVETVTSHASEGLSRSLEKRWDLLIWDLWMPFAAVSESPDSPEQMHGDFTAGLKAIRQLQDTLKAHCPPILVFSVLAADDSDCSRSIRKELVARKVAMLPKPSKPKEICILIDSIVDKEGTRP